MTADAINRKYELTDNMLIINGDILYRIRALRDIPRYGVKAGDLGGFVESEANLSHEGDCWIGGKARVCEKARVSENAYVSGDSCVFGNAVVSGNVYIPVSTSIGGNAEIIESDHVIFIGPVGANNEYLMAYRTKGGDPVARCCGEILGFSSRKRDRTLDYLVDTCNNGNYWFLFEMARNDPENWSDNEYRFMIETLLYRAGHWKQTVEPEMGSEKETSEIQDHVASAPKYELTDETRIVDGRTLYRIRAMRDIEKWCVETNDPGGFVESEANLSHEGACWITNDACVYEEACVSEDAYTCDDVRVTGRARISGRAIISGHTRVSGEVSIFGDACAEGNVQVSENAVVGGIAHLPDGAWISDDAEIAESVHTLFIGPIGPQNQYLTIYRTKGGGYSIRDNDGRKLVGLDKGADDNNYRFLLEMARSESGDLKRDKYGFAEYSFMLEMARCRASRWKSHE